MDEIGFVGAMRILADENIPYVSEAFSDLGDVITVSGRAITAGRVRDAEVLVVRSITKVDRGLLEGSSVRFVGTATIGEEHVDTAYLAEQGIGFASAPGSNANSVAEYVVAALLELAHRFHLNLTGMKLGIVGVGNIGSRVEQKATALGMSCVLNDPPLWRQTGDSKYRSIEEIFDCEIVTLHVPLTHSGPDATFHMVDGGFLGKLAREAILINTARGAVVDGAALKRALEQRFLKAAVVDVWENEPDIDVDLLKHVFIGTPHIAGYSFDGKVNGTKQIYEAACRFFGISPAWDPGPLLPKPVRKEIAVDGSVSHPLEAVRGAVSMVYDIWRDDRAMRALIQEPPEKRGSLFDRLRRDYPVRREFFNTRVSTTPTNVGLAAQLNGIGFECEAV